MNSGSSDLIETLALKQGLGLSEMSAALLNGGTIDVPIDENIVLRNIDKTTDAFWNFLLFSGYLKVTNVVLREGRTSGSLSIPNKEVKLVYEDLFYGWLRRADPTSHHIKEFVNALLVGDVETVQSNLEWILLTAMSYQDPAGAEPEKLYHGLILGLLVHLEERYEVRSNRESGYGRADVLMRPKTPGQPGVVIEFKVMGQRKTVDEVLKDAAKQVRDRKYAAELTAAGASPVYEYAMVFDGKQAWVGRVEDVVG